MHFTCARYLPRILMLLKHILFVSWHVVLAYAMHHHTEKLNQIQNRRGKKKKTVIDSQIVRVKENFKLSYGTRAKDKRQSTGKAFFQGRH